MTGYIWSSEFATVSRLEILYSHDPQKSFSKIAKFFCSLSANLGRFHSPSLKSGKVVKNKRNIPNLSSHPDPHLFHPTQLHTTRDKHRKQTHIIKPRRNSINLILQKEPRQSCVVNPFWSPNSRKNCCGGWFRRWCCYWCCEGRAG